jgi:predicted nucleic acid-binding protein
VSSAAVYLDSSALVKLCVVEAESEALREWVGERLVISSALARTEVIRAVRFVGPAALAAARSLLGEVDLVTLDDGLLDTAATSDGPMLRSLDAIHLASATTVRAAIDAFIAYDRRLLEAARAEGFATASPGAD